MSETSGQQPMMTNVKGYFNPKPYPVNVSISELGLSVQLKPMEFILDRASGRKINDPILDKYVGYQMLSAELATAPVPVIAIPKIAPPVQSLHVVGQGIKDASGKWVPAPANQQQPQSMVQVPPSVTKPSVAAMSMEEARRRGFVGKAKLVDENYGAPETDGAPTRGDAIPRIKYAMESRAPLAQSGQLPKELVEEIQPTAAPIIAGLQKAAQSDLESVNLGRKAAEQAVKAQQGEQGVQQFRANRKQVAAKAKMPHATMPPAQQPPGAPPTIAGRPGPRRRVGQVVVPAAPAPAPQPPPAAPVPQPMPVGVESPLMGGRPEQLPEPLLEDQAQSAQAPEPAEPPPTAEDRAAGAAAFRCGACGREFPYKSYYIRHILRAHKDRVQELMPAEHP